MIDWKWLLGFSTPILIALVVSFYKIFERLVKLETDNIFTTKIIWEFLISKVHNDNDNYRIDELLDKWKNHKLKNVREIEQLIIGLNKVIEIETDNSKKAAAELLLKMLDKGIGIVERM